MFPSVGVRAGRVEGRHGIAAAERKGRRRRPRNERSHRIEHPAGARLGGADQDFSENALGARVAHRRSGVARAASRAVDVGVFRRDIEQTGGEKLVRSEIETAGLLSRIVAAALGAIPRGRLHRPAESRTPVAPNRFSIRKRSRTTTRSASSTGTSKTRYSRARPADARPADARSADIRSPRTVAVSITPNGHSAATGNSDTKPD